MSIITRVEVKNSVFFTFDPLKQKEANTIIKTLEPYSIATGTPGNNVHERVFAADYKTALELIGVFCQKGFLDDKKADTAKEQILDALRRTPLQNTRLEHAGSRAQENYSGRK